MEVLQSIPLTLNERIPHGPELRIPASWDEFLDMLEECEYRIEYDEGEIISFMGYATDEHEGLVSEIIRLLGNLLADSNYRVRGSNLALHIPGFVRKYYNADCAVIQGPSEKVLLRGNMSAVANPILLVEVLSPTNREFDLGRKLKNYQKIPGLQQMDSEGREKYSRVVCASVAHGKVPKAKSSIAMKSFAGRWSGFFFW